MAARSDAAATPGLLVSSPCLQNSLTLLQNHQINTQKYIYDRQSLLEIGSVYLQTSAFAGDDGEATRLLSAAEYEPLDRGLAY